MLSIFPFPPSSFGPHLLPTGFDSAFPFCAPRHRQLSSFLSHTFPRGGFLAFYLLLPDLCFHSSSLCAPTPHLVSVPVAVIFPTPALSQAPFPRSQSVLRTLQDILSVRRRHKPLHFPSRTFPSAPVCFLTEVVSYTYFFNKVNIDINVNIR